MKGVSEREKQLEEELREVEERRAAALAALPNPADPTAPPEDEVLREEGEAGTTGRSHVELLGRAPRPRGRAPAWRARASST